jgi:hypothetical protein
MLVLLIISSFDVIRGKKAVFVLALALAEGRLCYVVACAASKSCDSRAPSNRGSWVPVIAIPSLNHTIEAQMWLGCALDGHTAIIVGKVSVLQQE